MANWSPAWPAGSLPKVGFIGLGIMGRPMARNLLNAGFALTVYNRTRAKADELAKEGAAAVGSPREVALASDVVITMVSDSPDVEEVILANGGVIEGARPGQAVIDMSTIAPDTARRLAERLAGAGVAFLDAPVSGGEKGAIEATLSIMVGGDEAVLHACLPVLNALGRNVVHVGPNGMGQTVKLCNQIICGLNLLAMAEGLTFAAKAGADLEKVLRVVTHGLGGSRILETLGPKVLAGDYSPGFMVKLQQKDLRLALEAGGAMRLSLPGTALVQQLLRHVEAIGCGEEGTQALVKSLATLGNVNVGAGGAGKGGAHS